MNDLMVRKISVAFAALVTLTPSLAFAACKQSDLAGKWVFTLHNDDGIPNGKGETLVCDSVSIHNDGSLETPSYCVQFTENAQDESRVYGPGKLIVGTKCDVTLKGRLTINFRNDVSNTFYQVKTLSAFLSPSNNMFMGSLYPYFAISAMRKAD